MTAPAIAEDIPRLLFRRRQRRDASYWTLASIATLILVFLYLPVVVLIVFSFNDNTVTTLPLRGFTLEWYEKMLNNADMLAAIGNSLYVATMATILTLLIGIPAAFALDRIDFPGKTAFRRMVLLPLAL